MSKEVFFNTSDIIVSKTNLKGHILYVNPIFCEVSGFIEGELLGKPHNVIRHKKMPRCVFKLLWDKISVGEEVFAYVVNTCKNSDYYWVFAHVTPSFDENGTTVAYHSNRRVPCPNVIKEKIEPLYASLLEIENSYENAKEGLEASFNHLVTFLEESHMSYEEFVFSLDPTMSNKI